MVTYNTLSSIEFYGKHSIIIDKISASNEELAPEATNPPLFTRVLDAYIIAGLIGMINDKKSTEDKTSPEKTRIFTETVQRNSPYIDFFASMPVILTQNMSKVSDIKRAFFSETNEEENYMLTRNRLFYEYALGGLELLDEHVIKPNPHIADEETSIFDRLEMYMNELERKFKIDEDFVDQDLIFNTTELEFDI
ncbi:MAG: hypothetical protein Q4Q00_13625 [Turicibacter sp.]|nr:hypothetical protein [Turicibacter sp.]